MENKSYSVIKSSCLFLFLGIVTGFFINFTKINFVFNYLNPLVIIFKDLLQMIFIPLIFSSIFITIINLKGKKIGKMTGYSAGYFLLSTTIAIMIGYFLVNTISPGEHINPHGKGFLEISKEFNKKLVLESNSFKNNMTTLKNLVPKNPFKSFTEMNLLHLIILAAIFALITIKLKGKNETFVDLIKNIENLSINFSRYLYKASPLIIFFMAAYFTSNPGINQNAALNKYILTICLGFFIYAVVLLTLASYQLKIAPWKILKEISVPLITAMFSISPKTIVPLTMVALEKKLALRKDTISFVIPLGGIFNNSATALYKTIATIFIAQTFGINLSAGIQLLIFITIIYTSMSVSMVKGADLITLSVVLTSAGLPLEGLGITLFVDRLVDMIKTPLDLLADCTGAIFVNSVMKE